MSTDQFEKRQDDDGASATAEGGVAAGSAGETPKSEIPIYVKVSTPSTVLTELAHRNAQGDTNDYFTPHPAETEQQLQQERSEPSRGIFPSSPPPPSTSSGTSDVTARGQVQQPASELSVPSSDRPVAHTTPSTWSVQSVDSIATVTAADVAGASAFVPTQRPAFPNQSYAALHHQQYPQPYIPPTLRQRTSQAGQIHTFTSALASIHQSGSRTVGNTPAATPSGGLFSVQPSPQVAGEWDSAVTPGTYASPFLHFTHRVPPKETHVADVDVDPVSGRKLINHYEVIDELGRGTHGKVKLGRDLHTNDTYVAIKIVERFSKRRRLGKLGTTEDKVKKEVAILKKARHPNIVALLEVIDDPSRKKVYIVLEWVQLGEIQWRAKAPREIAKLESRRYEREKSGINDERSIAQDVAVFSEVRKRLDRQRRRQRRALRQLRRQASEGPGAWSNEMMGDDESDLSEDDLLSRISTATGDSMGSRAVADDARRGSRASIFTRPSDDGQPQSQDSFLSVTAEPQTASPTRLRNEITDFGTEGLEGTMYGAYAVPSSSEPSRVPSAMSSIRSSVSSQLQNLAAGDNFRQLANEILDSELNDELEYVPVMTQQQCRVAFRDTMLGLQYLHYQGIVHRDIKPPNLLATKEHRVKISDFGVSYLGRPIGEDEPVEDVSEHEAQDLDDEAKELAKTVGTPAFYAPELCIQDPSEEALPVTKAIDVWALGITLFCMLFARTPFVDNEWVMMRQIADEEIYIPKKRLVPVEPRANSRTQTQARQTGNVTAGHRDDYVIAYEEISDDLHHLLHGLLTKDPRKRMTLEDVRKHPWTQADIADKATWLEETDPSRQSEGKKIEISREDMNAAVVPLLDRVRSGIKKVGERLGFGGGKTALTRTRTQSNASHSNVSSPVPSAASSSSNISQDGRRQSLRGDESILTALKASREGEHPLSKSVAASPDVERHSNPLEQSKGRPESAMASADRVDDGTPSRPHPPERANTIMATGGSMRTVRQSDFQRGRQEESPPPSPGLPSTPTTIENPSALGSLLSGGMARRILKSVRERSAARSSEHRSNSSDRGSVVGSIDTHGEPSLAMSQAVATGQVNKPAAFDSLPPTSNPASNFNSPGVSRPLSIVSSPSGDHLEPSAADITGLLSRTSSGGSITSVCKRHPANSISRLIHSPMTSSRPQSRTVPESSVEEWERAEREYIRKRIQEDREARPSSAFDDRDCPPSPDDSRNNNNGRESRRMSQLEIVASASSHETSPIGGQLASAMMSSCSDFGSTASASNPSLPSAVSEPSSMDTGLPSMESGHRLGRLADLDLDPINEAKRNASSDDTLEPRATTAPDDGVEGGYTADPDNDNRNNDDELEYDSGSSTDSDGGLVMSRRRSAPRRSSAAVSRDTAAAGVQQQESDRSRRVRSSVQSSSSTMESSSSSRSGSRHTMQKVRTRDSEEDEGLTMKRSS